ncbi:hypothetical protein Tco_1256287 [Tanacetum coccineum]
MFLSRMKVNQNTGLKVIGEVLSDAPGKGKEDTKRLLKTGMSLSVNRRSIELGKQEADNHCKGLQRQELNTCLASEAAMEAVLD